MGLETVNGSDAEGGRQESKGQSDRQVDDFENAVDGDSNNAEREQQQPD